MEESSWHSQAHASKIPLHIKLGALFLAALDRKLYDKNSAANFTVLLFKFKFDFDFFFLQERASFIQHVF